MFLRLRAWAEAAVVTVEEVFISTTESQLNQEHAFLFSTSSVPCTENSSPTRWARPSIKHSAVTFWSFSRKTFGEDDQICRLRGIEFFTTSMQQSPSSPDTSVSYQKLRGIALHLPYPPDLTHAGFYLFSKVKMQLKSHRIWNPQRIADLLLIDGKRLPDRISKLGGTMRPVALLHWVAISKKMDFFICEYMHSMVESRWQRVEAGDLWL